ncbi:OmpA family protein [Thaumasiovibrio sp. DFM-14]|uniref:OmpA family protein n=1 Tax=Thaumasiovibrio sp. DFM-14 TaxID=3384792 RepID=UPI0039A0E718
MKKLLLATLIAATAVTGCSTTNPYSGESQTAKATTGSVIGAVAGAAVGAASSSKGDRKKGILIGAASGAAVGGGIGYYMDVQEAKLREQLQASGITVTRNGDNIILNMPNEITFNVNETNLDSRAVLALRNVALVVKEYDQTMLNILGHTDSTGSASYNQELSQRRANEVRNQLIAEGVSPARLVATGRGESSPIANNSTEQGRAENRRVEIILSPLPQ